MLFRTPLAWIGLTAILVPIVIHLLVRAPAAPVIVASLRFVRASAMRARRRRRWRDGSLLAVRVGILALAAAALANPLLAGGCRERAWNARIARAVIVEARTKDAEQAIRELPPAFAARQVTASDLRAGLDVGLRWLETTPPARREVVVIGSLRLGAIDGLDLQRVSRDVGIRFVQTSPPGRQPEIPASVATRRVDDRIARTVTQTTIDGERTHTSMMTAPPPGLAIERSASGIAVPALGLDVVGPATAEPAMRAAVTAALAVGVPVPDDPKARPVVVAIGDRPSGWSAARGAAGATAGAAWVGDAIAGLAADPSMLAEARAAQARPSHADETGDGWLAVARDGQGRVVVVAASPDASSRAPLQAPSSWRLAVRAEPASTLVPALIRAALLARERAPRSTLLDAEVVPIAGAQLAAWTRPSQRVDAGALGVAQASDRRWAWGLVLVLLGIESVLRKRGQRARADAEEGHVVGVAPVVSRSRTQKVTSASGVPMSSRLRCIP